MWGCCDEVVALTVSSAVLAIGGVAIAADLPVKAPAYAAPLQDWTGIYVGGSAGGVLGYSRDDWTASPPVFPSSIAPTGSTTFKPAGFIGGGQVGYNSQASNVVWGVEGDLNYTGLSASRFAPIPPPFVNTVGGSVSSHFLATVRGRLGLTNGGMLLYFTGGLAFANVKFLDGTSFNTAAPFTNSSDSALAGWTVGAGAEWMINRNWSWKAEYLYVDLGKETNNGVTSGAVVLAPISFDHRLTEHIGRIGLNFNFGPK